MSVFVYRPGGIAGGNVFTNWQPLMAALSGVEGRKILVPRTRVDILSGARFTGR
jgi:hypothetical protein